jgi:hypothetical protein
MIHSRTLIAAGALALSAAMPAAAVTVYTATLSGAAEVTPNASPATGMARVTVDLSGKTMLVETTFADLLAPNTASHIHCCTAVPGTGGAGVATVTPTFTGFPAGTTSGSYSHLFDMSLASSYNGSFITGHGGTVDSAFAFFTAGLDAGEAYLNIHSTLYPGGEIRGFLHAVPEPETYALMLLGLGLVGWANRRRRDH